MAQVTWRASAAKASGTGAITPALPAGMSAGDIVILVASTIAGATMSITANGSISTWTAIGTGHQDVAAGEHLYAWWGRWSSGTTGPTVTPSSDHACAGTIAFYNCNQVSPIDVVAWSSEATSDTSFSFATGLTSTEATSLAIVICSSGEDSTTGQFSGAFTNASLTSITTRLNFQTNSGLGGGFGMAQGVKATAGTIGTWTETLAVASPKAYVCFVLKPPVDTTLTVQEAFHGDIADGATLTQVHQLAPSEAAHAMSSDAPVLTQAHQLTVQEAAHGQAADGVVLTQAHRLAVSKAYHGLTSDTMAITENKTLAVQEARHLLTSDAPTLTQVHILAVAEAYHSSSTDGLVVLTENKMLVVQNAGHSQAVENVGLTQVHILSIQDSEHSHFSGVITLFQAHILFVYGGYHGHKFKHINGLSIPYTNLTGSLSENSPSADIELTHFDSTITEGLTGSISDNDPEGNLSINGPTANLK